MIAAAISSQEESATAHIAAIEARTGARIGVAALDTASGKRLDYRSEERFPMCSTFKFLAAAAVLKRVDEGKEKLDPFLSYGAKEILEYAPVTKAHLKDGGMALGALCEAAIEQSDNTAGNLLLDTIGGPSGLTSFVRSIGDETTRLDRKEPELNSAIPGDERDTTSPAVMCANMQRLLLGNALSESSRHQLEDWLQHNETGALMIRAGVPKTWTVGDKRDDAETERRTMLPLFVHRAVHRSSLLFTRSARLHQRMIVLQLLRKQRVPSWSLCLRNCSRRLWATPRFPQRSGYRITCPNFADAQLALLDLAIAHEKLELPYRSSFYGNCRRSATRSKRRSGGSRAHHSRFARKQSLSPLPSVGTAWRACHSVSVRRDSVWSPVF